ncbi:MAG: hypothetical protein ACKVE4_09795 [Dissulfuribacterales bacterium]
MIRVLYYIIPNNHAWYINGQDLLLIGEFLSTGLYPIKRVVTFSDGTSKNSKHIKTRMGVSLNDLYPLHSDMDHLRWIVGGIFSGYTSHADGFLGMYETSVMVIEESIESEFFGFALLLCLTCSLLLTAASTRLKPYQVLNVQTDRKKNILKAIGLIDSNTEYTTEAINRLYSKNIFKFTVDKTGTITDEQTKPQADYDNALPIYLSIDKANKIRSYIIPIATGGLWGKIYGYLALQKDGSTIKGFTVYKHSD